MQKFGIKIVQKGYDFKSICKLCSTAEELGFDSFWVSDHMYSWGRKITSDPALECWTLLSCLSQITTRIRLGSLVICNLFRHPAILAKMASSLDVISGGRLNFGIGAGGPSTPAELQGFGFPRAKRKERIQRLSESIDVIRALWTNSKANFSGQYYSIRDAINSPQPVQKPHPPILVGGERDDILEIVSKQADAWNCRRFSVEDFASKVSKLDKLCDLANRPDVIKSWQGSIIVATDPARLESMMKKYPAEEGRISGNPEEVIQKISKYVDVGASYFMFRFQDDLDETSRSSMELFVDKVAHNF